MARKYTLSSVKKYEIHTVFCQENMSTMANRAFGDYDSRNSDVEPADLKDGREKSETQVEISEGQKKIKHIEKKMKYIKDALDKSWEFMEEDDKKALRKKLFELCMQRINDAECGFRV